MTKLSITLAWNESAEFIRRHGGPLFTIALAFLMVPGVAVQLLAPADNPPRPGLWMLAAIVVIVLAIAGNLAMASLALGREVVVGKAIAHGFRRTPSMLGAALLVGIAFGLVFGVLLVASGIDPQHPDPAALAANGRFAAVMLVMFLLLLFVAVRMIMTNPAAAAEPIGPIGILTRSWTLTGRAMWKLLGLVLLLLVLLFIVTIAIKVVLGSLLALTLGAPRGANLANLILLLVTGIVNAALTVALTTLLARIYVQLAGEPISGT